MFPEDMPQKVQDRSRGIYIHNPHPPGSRFAVTVTETQWISAPVLLYKHNFLVVELCVSSELWFVEVKVTPPPLVLV